MKRLNVSSRGVLQYAPTIILFCLLAVISCAKKEAGPNESVPLGRDKQSAKLPKVTVAKPSIEEIRRIITAVGTLEPEDDVQITSQVSGIIQEIKFEEGQEVKQGAVMAILDPTNFNLNLENSKALLDRAQSDLSLAQFNYDREKKLFEKSFVPEQEFQQYAASLDSAKAALASAQASLKISQKALEDSVIKAPVDKAGNNYVWEIQKKLASIGQYIIANAGTPIAELVNRTTLKLRFTVSEQDAVYLGLNKTVQFTVPALPKKEFEAKIIFLGPEAVENTRSVIVKARFDNAERILRPGYSANVKFIAETKEKALVISRRSLRFDVDNPYVLVVNGDILHKKPVTVGIEEENIVDITSGINPSDMVVVRSSSFLEDGTKIEVVEDK